MRELGFHIDWTNKTAIILLKNSKVMAVTEQKTEEVQAIEKTDEVKKGREILSRVTGVTFCLYNSL